MKVNYLVIGQGISGSFLSWNLLKEKKSVLVMDEARPFSSTKVASGVINPVTGRRMVKTWMIDELLPAAESEYRAFGETLEAALVKQCDLLLFHPTAQMRDAFEQRYESDKQYVEKAASEAWERYFNFYYGVGKISPCLHIDLHTLLDKWRDKLLQQDALLEERFDNRLLRYSDTGVQYKDIDAGKIIFCNGTGAFHLPYFELLPYASNKGEVLIAEIPGLPTANIYKMGLSIVPWKDKLFWIGSTYEWEFSDLLPTKAFRAKAEEQLKQWLKIPFSIVDHMASERPATVERRPFVGLHPVHPAIGIFNGMGTKGCSLAPYFARQFAKHLVHGEALSAEADIQRFKRILSQRSH